MSTKLRALTRKYENYTGPDKIKILLDEFNNVNYLVSSLCNHKKAISKSFKFQIEKIDEQINKLKEKLKKTENSDKKKKLMMTSKN